MFDDRATYDEVQQQFESGPSSALLPAERHFEQHETSRLLSRQHRLVRLIIECRKQLGVVVGNIDAFVAPHLLLPDSKQQTTMNNEPQCSQLVHAATLQMVQLEQLYRFTEPVDVTNVLACIKRIGDLQTQLGLRSTTVQKHQQQVIELDDFCNLMLQHHPFKDWFALWQMHKRHQRELEKVLLLRRQASVDRRMIMIRRLLDSNFQDCSQQGLHPMMRTSVIELMTVFLQRRLKRVNNLRAALYAAIVVLSSSHQGIVYTCRSVVKHLAIDKRQHARVSSIRRFVREMQVSLLTTTTTKIESTTATTKTESTITTTSTATSKIESTTATTTIS